MGGSIEVQSVYGEGTTFTVRIPQGFVTDEPIDAKTAASLRHFQYTENRRDSGGTRVDIHLPHVQVLVVDDNQTNLAVAQGMLGLYNMQIDCVDSGAKALELIRDESPIYQAIFMDHLMPGMDGIETFERIRDIGTEYATGVPVIALTANAIAGNAEMFESKGFAAFLSKPIDRVQLDTIVSRLFCDGKVSKPGSDLAELGALGIDVASGLGRLGEDVEGYRKVLRLYRTETASLLARLRGFGSEQLDEYAVVVHGIKGSSRGIGAENVAAAAEKLEVAAKAGDWRFVQKESGAFFEQTEVLIVGMEKALSIVGSSKDTPGDTSKTGGRSNTSKKNREKPDHRALKRLREAAADFSIDGIENALDDLEGYDYRTEGELIVWLRGKCDSLAFDEIAARLSDCESDNEYQEAS
jgi:CheY-like chemotaxis protein